MIPKLSSNDRLSACHKGVEARQIRAAAKEDFAAQRVGYLSILDSKDEAIQRMKVRDFIRCIPGIGKVKADDALDALGIAASRRISGLGIHQREKLIGFLNEHGMRP